MDNLIFMFRYVGPATGRSPECIDVAKYSYDAEFGLCLQESDLWIGL